MLHMLETQALQSTTFSDRNIKKINIQKFLLAKNQVEETFELVN